MPKRILFLAALTLLVGFFTRAFAQDAIVPMPSPNTTITRAGAVAYVINADARDLQRVQWYAKHMPPMPLFKDVDQTQWYAPYLEVAFEQGLITGNDSRLFRPSDSINQAEVIALVTRYKEIEDPSAGVYLTIAPQPTQENWLNATVSQAVTNGIKLPFPVQPTVVITRQDLYDMLASAGVPNADHIQIAMIPVQSALPLNIIDSTMIASTDPTIGLQPLTNAAVDTAPVTTGGTTTTHTTITPTLAGSTTQAADATTPYLSSKSFAISMPSLGILDLGISHPSDFSHDGLLVPLKSGVGHLFSYPGQGGTILVYGHSSGYPWDVSKYTKIFRQINKLSVGDKIYITYNKTLYIYQVTFKQTVPADDTSAYAQAGHEELILYTCWPPDSIKQRYLVHASPVQVVAAK